MHKCCNKYKLCKELGACIGRNVKSYSENISRKVFDDMSITKPSRKTIEIGIPKN